MTIDWSPEFVAQAAHLSFAGFLTLALVHLFGVQVELPVVLSGVVLAAVKEFYVDIHYETPAYSGGYKGGLADFSFYVAGLGAAVLTLLR